MKEKKQFRLFDVYRSLTMTQESNIHGIRSYYAVKNDDAATIGVDIVFHSYEEVYRTFEIGRSGEQKLKEFIREVNKLLKNCRKPGPKSKSSKNKGFL